MGKGPRYRVVLKRRRQHKTDYRKRKTMVLSKISRFTVRGSLANMTAQLVDAFPVGDRTLATAHSRELAAYGWKAPCGNIPAAYLTGLLLGFKAQALNVHAAIPDIGLRRSSPGARVFAAIKGARDAGLALPCGDVLPDEARLRGEHIAAYATKLAVAEADRYRQHFSQYLSKNVLPADLPAHFAVVKANIVHAFQQDGS